MLSRGLAEFGPNYFVLRCVGNNEPNDIIGGIMETPINFKVNTSWADTGKASLLKKMYNMESSIAAGIGAVAGIDMTVPLLGESTFKQYVGVSEIDYHLKTTVFNGKAFSDTGVVSNGAEITNFLKKHATINSSLNGFETGFTNVLKSPFKVFDKINQVTDLLNTVEETFDSNQANQAWAACYKFYNAVVELTKSFKTDMNVVLQRIYEKTKKLAIKTGDSEPEGFSDLVIKTTDSNGKKLDEIRISMNPKVLGWKILNWFSDGAGRDDIVKINAYGALIDSYSEQSIRTANNQVLNDEIHDLLIKCMNTQFSVAESDFIENFMEQMNKDDTEYNNIKVECNNLFYDLIKKYNEKLFDKKKAILSSKTQIPLAEQNSKFTQAADILLFSKDKTFGQFDHHISPCLLYFSLCGKIFTEPVLVKGWSVNNNVWNFKTEFDITFERARIDTYEGFFNGSYKTVGDKGDVCGIKPTPVDV